MSAGARATIYPGQIARSFKVMKVEFVAVAANDAFVIQDNSTAANILCQGIATNTVANTVLQFDFATGVTWADWKVTTLTAAGDKLLIYVK
jgi:hypothetical protein